MTKYTRLNDVWDNDEFSLSDNSPFGINFLPYEIDDLDDNNGSNSSGSSKSIQARSPNKKRTVDLGPFVTRNGVHSASYSSDKGPPYQRRDPTLLQPVPGYFQPNYQNDTFLSLALLQELRDRDRRLELEMEKRNNIEKEFQQYKTKNTSTSPPKSDPTPPTSSTTSPKEHCCCATSGGKKWTNLFWLFSIAVLFIIFAIWVACAINGMNKKISCICPNNISTSGTITL